MLAYFFNFNSRPSARGDGLVDVKPGVRGVISIHAPPRGATRCGRSTTKSKAFQFTPLREGRPGKDGHPAGFRHFNSRPSARGDGYMVKKGEHAALFQFTPLREGRRADGLKKNSTCHTFQFTPLREGRRQMYHNCQANGLFQFTPLREGRRGHPNKSQRFRHFNSRPSARGDAPAKPQRAAWATYFNSRPSARGDASETAEGSMGDLFQFTPLREGRRRRIPPLPASTDFNSRPSARGDAS